MQVFEILAEDPIQTLSYGDRKKVMIAFILACNTKFVIMDEPTNGLDIPSKKKFRKIIAESFNSDRIYLISTHQVKDLENLIDHVIVLRNHQILINEELENIGRLVFFSHLKDITNKKFIYSEPSLHGYDAILENSEGKESKIPLELFFNACISEPQKMNSVLKNQKSISR